VNEEKKEDAE